MDARSQILAGAVVEQMTFETRQERHHRQGAAWSRAIDETSLRLGATAAPISNLASICDVLQPFLAEDNIAFWPYSGYFSLKEAGPVSEYGCIELRDGMHNSLIVRPRQLNILRLERDLSQSFLLLELEDLNPLCGEHHIPYNFEIIWVTSSGGYAYDCPAEDTLQECTPPFSRAVNRYFSGNILIVSPCSILNSVRRADDGSFTHFSAMEVQTIIESALSRIDESSRI